MKHNLRRDAEIAETLGIRLPQVEALRTDKHAVRVTRGRGVVDLAIGETMRELFQGDNLLQLGYSKQTDYMRDQQTERESTEEENQKNRAAGVRCLWGPKDAVQTVTDAIVSAQAAWVGIHGETPDAGQALALVAAYFLKVHEEHRPGRSMPRERREVLMCEGGT